MTVIQILGILISIIVLYSIYLKTKNRQISLFEGILWGFIWILAVVFLIYPQLTGYIAEFLGVGRGVDAITYLSLALLFYLVYKLYARIDKLERDITKIVRELAIRDRYEPKKRT